VADDDKVLDMVSQRPFWKTRGCCKTNHERNRG
jgi:hypothetical protein